MVTSATTQDTEEELRFEGIDGDECEEFIRAVRIKALNGGKQRDNDWIIDYVNGCFAGEALRWHLTLPQEIQDDWHLLQQAMLDHYPAVEETKHAPRTSLPTPAAVGPAKSLPPEPRTGRIKVVTGIPSVGAYIAKAPDARGIFVTCSNPSEALIIRFTPTPSPFDIQLLPKSSPPLYLAAQIFVNPGQNMNYEGPPSAVLQAEEALTTPKLGTNSYLKTKIWTISPDGTLKAQLNTDLAFDPVPCVNLNTHAVVIVGDYVSFSLYYWERSKHRYCKARLVFEAV